MSRHPFLQSFNLPNSEIVTSGADTGAIESIKSEAFEAGYASGWEDAVASDKTARMTLEAEFERNIQNVAFTYGEAVSHIRGELRELLTALIEQFLPATAPDILLAHIKTELLRLGDELTSVPVEVVTSPDCNSAVAKMLSSDFSIDINLIEDHSLSPSQVYLRLGSREVEINLEPLIKAVSSQLEALSNDIKGEGNA